ncbi:MAG: hypothetical protein ACRDRZ_04365, partial [Pseudonocardiaceae bacterium]
IHEAAALPALRREAASAVGEHDVFRDPFLDEPAGGQLPSVRPLLLGVVDDPDSAPARAAVGDMLPGIETADGVGAGEELMIDPGDPAAAACAAAVLALRLDMAALYLGLGRGVLGGPGRVGTGTA